jgi:hypothetical protein
MAKIDFSHFSDFFPRSPQRLWTELLRRDKPVVTPEVKAVFGPRLALAAPATVGLLNSVFISLFIG